MDISPERQTEILTALKELADARLGTIDDAKELRREEEERHVEILRAISAGHRDANRALVEAIESAHRAGLRKRVIYEHVGLSSQRLGQIKTQIRRWENTTEDRSTA